MKFVVIKLTFSIWVGLICALIIVYAIPGPSLWPYVPGLWVEMVVVGLTGILSLWIHLRENYLNDREVLTKAFHLVAHLETFLRALPLVTLHELVQPRLPTTQPIQTIF